MAKKIHTVALPDGTSATRESDRPYTHAVVHITTEAERARRVAEAEGKIAALEAKIAGLRAAAGSEADKAAYQAASSRLAHLEEEIVEECLRTDGSKYVARHPRWLSDAFRGAGRRAVDEVWAARDATARGQIERAERDLEHIDLAKIKARPVGEARVYRWSMSLRGAQQGAAEVLRWNPLDEVVITTDIQIRARAARPKKAPAGAAQS